MPRRFVTLDVFTGTKLAGNPLAVVLDAEGLSTERMQAIAREFNLSETVFVMPSADPTRRADIRIFTPSYEMPFAGHPTIGTAVLLALQDTAGAGGERAFVLGEKVGPISCRVRISSPSDGRAEFDVAETPRRIGEVGPAGAVAAALGVGVTDIGFPGAEGGYYSAGTPFAIIPFISPEAVDRAEPHTGNWMSAFGMNDRRSVFMIAPTAEKGVYHARMFAYGATIYEDPATGSASAACAALITGAERQGDGDHHRLIRQGYRMGRPSQISLTCRVSGGRLTGATIGGQAVIVSEGKLHL
jgi:trans-2,3-dihydro-3-hydroxyanthranilate isomerase